MVNPCGRDHFIKRNNYLRSIMKHILLFLILILFWNPLYAYGPNEVDIHGRAIIFPLNRILLVQRADYLGALIFISYEKSTEGDMTRYRSYKRSAGGWREENEGTIGFKSLTWAQWLLGALGSHTQVLSRIKPLELNGFSLLAHPTEDGKCVAVYYGLDPEEPDRGVKIAPTPWRTIEEVNMKELRLKWYSSTSQAETIKMEELWR